MAKNDPNLMSEDTAKMLDSLAFLTEKPRPELLAEAVHWLRGQYLDGRKLARPAHTNGHQPTGIGAS